jgi:hypothetical protein
MRATVRPFLAGLLRPMNGLMVAPQYYHNAEELRFGGTGAL